jgi:phosphoribosylformimino-5-aminoimidazole carboxamide ribotide isomerase
MKIIPAIDLIDGKCVRLTKGDYATKKIYNSDPLEVAQSFEAVGIRHLHLVDLDGAKAGKIINHKVLERIAQFTNLQIDFGGGVKTEEDLQLAFDSGATQVTGGSIAVQNPTLFLQWVEKYGAEKIILGADCYEQEIRISGWTTSSGSSVIDFIQSYAALGLREVICTDIALDGMLAGPSFELYQEILAKAPISLIASGGIRNVEDLRALAKMGCSGAIVGKSIYEGWISLEELGRVLNE